jgi:uncharacterized protein
VTEQLILWRRVDRPGHEAARLSFHEPFWHLSGTAVFANAGQPCRLEYFIACSSSWQTLRSRVTGWMGRQYVRLDVLVDPAHRWRMNGRECAEVAGCIDLDLGFSPATNLLPNRRLGLSAGEAVDVTAAWLRVPELSLEPLAQNYRRLDDRVYRYESSTPGFAADLEVNPAGLVVRYPGLWEIES